MMKFVEEASGIGDLMENEMVLRRVRYCVRRFQGVSEGSGLPIPGLHRIEGSIEFEAGQDPSQWIGSALNLKLEDGRILAITLVDGIGQIFGEGHGPSSCLCC